MTYETNNGYAGGYGSARIAAACEGVDIVVPDQNEVCAEGVILTDGQTCNATCSLGDTLSDILLERPATVSYFGGSSAQLELSDEISFMASILMFTRLPYSSCLHPNGFRYDNFNVGALCPTGSPYLARVVFKFFVPADSYWSFDFNVDFYYGAVITLDGEVVLDMVGSNYWWNYCTDCVGPFDLTGLWLSKGYHTLSLYAAESCCNGGSNIRFSSSISNGWKYVNEDNLRAYEHVHGGSVRCEDGAIVYDFDCDGRDDPGLVMECSSSPSIIPHSIGMGMCHDFPVGSECTYECENGYTSHGVVLCEGPDSWRVDGACVPNSCNVIAPESGDMGSCTSTLESNAACIFECNSGYTVTQSTACEAGAPREYAVYA
eukprot:g3354.t1